MSINHYEVLSAFGLGCDPQTGEVLPPEALGFVQREDIANAMRWALTRLPRGRTPEIDLASLFPIAKGHPLQSLQWLAVPLLKISAELHDTYPECIVFVQSGFFWECFGDDARRCSELFGWQVTEDGMTGFPIRGIEPLWKLRDEGCPFILVAQVDFPSTTRPPERHAVGYFPGGKDA